MRVALISNLRDGARREDLIGYDQVVAFHLRRELSGGCDCVLVRDFEAVDMPEVDAAVCINSRSIFSMYKKHEGDPVCRAMREAIEARSSHQFWLTDADSRGLLRFGRPFGDRLYIGMGVDPEACYPEQTATPVVLFNAWNVTVRGRGLDSDPVHLRMVKAAEAAAREGCEVWALNCSVGCATKTIGNIDPRAECEGNGMQIGYIPWEQVCAAYRKAYTLFDATPKPIELGRLEAQACGASCVMAPNDKMRDEPHIDALDHCLWGNDDMADVLLRSVSGWTPQKAADRHARVLEHFSWLAVAARLLSHLKSSAKE